MTESFNTLIKDKYLAYDTYEFIIGVLNKTQLKQFNELIGEDYVNSYNEFKSRN